ncbi:hypothetical protein Hanom_Chr07g00646491 [Helianthus anomalus]
MCVDDIQDPSVHSWGGLTATRVGTLTLLDCYLYSKSLKGLQNVCRGHLTRGTCALHIARRYVDTLVDFWSALGEETRHSLLKMEEDFMEHQMYRYVLTIDFVSNLNNLIKYYKHIPSLMEKNISMFFQSCVLLPYGLFETY